MLASGHGKRLSQQRPAMAGPVPCAGMQCNRRYCHLLPSGRVGARLRTDLLCRGAAEGRAACACLARPGRRAAGGRGACGGCGLLPGWAGLMGREASRCREQCRQQGGVVKGRGSGGRMPAVQPTDALRSPLAEPVYCGCLSMCAHRRPSGCSPATLMRARGWA